MITGSVASNLQGEPRSTHDIDIVIAIQKSVAKKLVEAFPPPDFHLDEDSILNAINMENMFNLIEHFGISKKFWNVGGCLKGVSPLQGRQRSNPSTRPFACSARAGRIVERQRVERPYGEVSDRRELSSYKVPLEESGWNRGICFWQISFLHSRSLPHVVGTGL